MALVYAVRRFDVALSAASSVDTTALLARVLSSADFVEFISLATVSTAFLFAALESFFNLFVAVLLRLVNVAFFLM